MLKRILVSIICCIGLVFGLSFASSAADKVGYINLQKLVNESEMGKAARNDILKLRAAREKGIRDKLKEYNDIKESINKEGDKMTPSETIVLWARGM